MCRWASPCCCLCFRVNSSWLGSNPAVDSYHGTGVGGVGGIGGETNKKEGGEREGVGKEVRIEGGMQARERIGKKERGGGVGRGEQEGYRKRGRE